jgi:uncharacterized membrane protein YczE
MANWKQSKFYHLFLIITSLVLAILFYSGIVLKDDLTGRIIIGTVWFVVSIGWLGQYVNKIVKHSESRKIY